MPVWVRPYSWLLEDTISLLPRRASVDTSGHVGNACLILNFLPVRVDFEEFTTCYLMVELP